MKLFNRKYSKRSENLIDANELKNRVREIMTTDDDVCTICHNHMCFMLLGMIDDMIFDSKHGIKRG